MTSQRSDADSDVLVIGGGVIGVCSAYYLAQRGLRVTLLEQAEICSGASWGNAGFVCLSRNVPLAAPGVVGQALKWMWDPTSPFYIRLRFDRALFAWLWRFMRACNRSRMHGAMRVLRELGLASRALYDELSKRDDLAFEMRRDGILFVYGTPRAHAHGVAEATMLREHGIRSEVLDRHAVQDTLGNLACTGAGGVLYPDDAHLNPGEFVQGLSRLAQNMGVHVRQGTEVLGWEALGRSIGAVRTTRGDFRARQVVLAAGAWVPSVARELRIRLPIQPAKGYSISVERPANCPRLPMLLGETKVAVTPLADTLRLGGTLELAGMDGSVTRARVDAIVQTVHRFFPTLEDSRLVEIWRGLRPCTPDGLPVVGRVRAYDNLVMAAGHGTLGIVLGPVTGKLVSEIIMEDAPAIDLAPLSPERFG